MKGMGHGFPLCFPVIPLHQHENFPVSFYNSLSHAAIKTHIMNHR